MVSTPITVITVRLAPVQVVDGDGLGGGPWTTVKGGTTGKVWLKAKFVNVMAALLAMVNVNIPLPVTGEGDFGSLGLG